MRFFYFYAIPLTAMRLFCPDHRVKHIFQLKEPIPAKNRKNKKAVVPKRGYFGTTVKLNPRAKQLKPCLYYYLLKYLQRLPA